MDKIISPDNESTPEISDSLKAFEKWKKENGITDEDSAVGSTAFFGAISNQKIPDLTQQHSALADSLSDKTHLQGSSKTKHGAAAERIEVHNKNAEAIKNNQAPNAELSSNGIDPTTDLYIDGKPYQVKFYRNAAETLNAIANEKYKDVGKIVPKEQYQDIIELAQKRQAKALEAAEKCKQSGDSEGYEKHIKEAEKYKNVIETTEQSTVTRNQAQFELDHPELAEAARVIRDIGKAGVSSALPAAAVSAVITGATSLYQVAKGDVEAVDALLQTGKSTLTSAATAFGVGAGGAAISVALTKAAQKVSKEALKENLESFAGSSAPTYIALAVIETSKSAWRYSQGKITAGEFAIELGEKAVCTVISNIAGSIAAPAGPVASIVFSTAAYMATSAMYRGVVDAIKWAKTADEAKKLFAIADELYESLKAQRAELEAFIKGQQLIRQKVFEESFDLLEQALANTGIEDFSVSLSSILLVYGKELAFNSLGEFNAFMNDEKTVLKI